MTIAYRPAEIRDAEFIVSNWSRTYKASKSCGMIAPEDWAAVMHRQIQQLLNRPEVQTIVAYENTVDDFLYGFIAGNPVGSPPFVFWVHVKENYRKAGYARGLFAALGIDPALPFAYTCWTPIIMKVSSKIPRTTHIPLTRYPQPEHRNGTHGHDEARRAEERQDTQRR